MSINFNLISKIALISLILVFFFSQEKRSSLIKHVKCANYVYSIPSESFPMEIVNCDDV